MPPKKDKRGRFKCEGCGHYFKQVSKWMKRKNKATWLSAKWLCDSCCPGGCWQISYFMLL